MKKLFLFLFMLVPMLAQAYDAKIDGIYYNLNDSEATVTYYSSYYNDNKNAHSGAVNSAFEGCSGLTSVTIPNSVTNI